MEIISKEYHSFVNEEVNETDRDIWRLDHLGFEVRQNPVHLAKTISFTGIPQKEIREQVKRAIRVDIHTLSVGTVKGRLTAVNHFSKYLDERHPLIRSLTDLNRDIWEEYLIYVNTEAIGRKSFRKELSSLKCLLQTVSLCEEAPQLENLFFRGDIPRRRICTYQAYSDKDLQILSELLHALPEQNARALLLHQILGNRISETLSLKRDCLTRIDGKAKVRIFMHKPGRTIYKPANDTVIKLIEKSIDYSNKHYGKSEYIFVNAKDPEMPMSYRSFRHHLQKQIRLLDLRDENGVPFTAKTHIYRNTMGQKLTSMHVPDRVIAMLLGHNGTSCLQYYRAFNCKVLADETREFRIKKDNVMRQFIKEWNTPCT